MWLYQEPINQSIKLGERVWIRLERQGKQLHFEFFDGNNLTADYRSFRTLEGAKRFYETFSEEMKKNFYKDKLLHIGQFREF